jgi:hypothetical protein
MPLTECSPARVPEIAALPHVLEVLVKTVKERFLMTSPYRSITCRDRPLDIPSQACSIISVCTRKRSDCFAKLIQKGTRLLLFFTFWHPTVIVSSVF